MVKTYNEHSNHNMRRPVVKQEIVDFMRTAQAPVTGHLEILETFAKTHNIPVIPHETVAYFRFLLQTLQPKMILEVGTAIGFSALLMAEQVPDAKVTTIDRNPEMTDRKWLAFALAQVLDNALKYSHPGGQIAVDLTDGIAISDQGMGILPEDLPRLGQEGFTGYNGHLHQKATGFGLYMTKTILNQLELEMTISSQLDVGTTVRVVKK